MINSSKLEEYKRACLSCYESAKKKYIGMRPGFNKHFFRDALMEVWSSFDGYLNYVYQLSNSRNKHAKFSADYQIKYEKTKFSDEFKDSIIRLKHFSPIEDMRADFNRKVPLNDENKLRELVEFCWVIRCNLDHGSKDLIREDSEGIKNRDLVEKSFNVMFEILQKVLMDFGWI